MIHTYAFTVCNYLVRRQCAIHSVGFKGVAVLARKKVFIYRVSIQPHRLLDIYQLTKTPDR